jgi:hypothetical protein
MTLLLLMFPGHDRRSSSPFISGDTFRSNATHVCEDANRCRMDPTSVKNGSCVFVKSDMFDFFAKEVMMITKCLKLYLIMFLFLLNGLQTYEGY